MDATFKNTSSKDQKFAQKSVAILKSITSKRKNKEAIVFQVDGASISIPSKAVALLEKVLDEMADGRSIVINSFEKELSTQEAADILKVSRPHLVKLLESGKIPYKMVGTHRRVLLEDITKYRRNQQDIRRKALEEISKDAQELDLGY